MFNVNDIIGSMRPDVDSICEATKIVLHEHKQSNTKISGFAKKIFQIMQEWIVSEEWDKIDKLTNCLRKTLNDDGVVVLDSIRPGSSIAELTLILGVLEGALQ